MKTFLETINGERHEIALRLFMVVVLAHWAEHLFQTFQIYVLGWPVPEARGVVGYFFPLLVSSELLHYGYALVMLAGLWALPWSQREVTESARAFSALGRIGVGLATRLVRSLSIRTVQPPRSASACRNCV